MIDFSSFNLVSFWQECDSIFEQFKVEQQPSECYGWRSWRVEKAFEKHSKNALNWVDEVGFDFIDSDGLKYEFCLLYTSPSPRDRTRSRMPSSA